MLCVVELLTTENKLKLGTDLSNFLIICLQQDKQFEQRISSLITMVSAQSNDLTKLCLYKENINLMLLETQSLLNIVFDVAKFYLATKDFEAI